MEDRHPSGKSQIEQIKAELEDMKWTPEKVLQALDENAVEHEKGLMIYAGLGLLGIFLGVCLLTASDNASYGGYGILLILISIGAQFPYLIELLGKRFKKRTKHAKSLIENNPEELVWAYIFVSKSNSVENKYWILNFRDGTKIKIEMFVITRKTPKHLKDIDNPHTFPAALYEINPNINLGYTQKLEDDYADGLL